MSSRHQTTTPLQPSDASSCPYCLRPKNSRLPRPTPWNSGPEVKFVDLAFPAGSERGAVEAERGHSPPRCRRHQGTRIEVEPRMARRHQLTIAALEHLPQRLVGQDSGNKKGRRGSRRRRKNGCRQWPLGILRLRHAVCRSLTCSWPHITLPGRSEVAASGHPLGSAHSIVLWTALCYELNRLLHELWRRGG